MVGEPGDGRGKLAATSCAVAWGGRGGGVDDVERVVQLGEDAAEGRFEQRVVSTAQQERLGCRGSGQSFAEVDAQDFVGDGMVGPAFLYQRN